MLFLEDALDINVVTTVARVNIQMGAFVFVMT